MAYIAIETRYIPPTEKTGAKIKVKALDQIAPFSDPDARRPSRTVAFDHSLNADVNHEKAAMQFLPVVMRDTEGVALVMGQTERGYVWTPVRLRYLESAPMEGHLRIN
jgi:hypothetical protein